MIWTEEHSASKISFLDKTSAKIYFSEEKKLGFWCTLTSEQNSVWREGSRGKTAGIWLLLETTVNPITPTRSAKVTWWRETRFRRQRNITYIEASPRMQKKSIESAWDGATNDFSVSSLPESYSTMPQLMLRTPFSQNMWLCSDRQLFKNTF